jgi:hypothetical protein
MWDIRARTAVYELATGNNAVVALAWDNARNSLYAATECRYIDRMGTNRDYRKAVIPKSRPAPSVEVADEADDNEAGAWQDEDEDEDEDDDDGKMWPKKANHAEDYFGHTFDAAGHRLCEFAWRKKQHKV